MEQYAVAHVSKGKGASNGLRAHIERETTPENADPSRSALNRIEDHGQNKSLSARADAVIQAAGVTRKVQADAVKYCPVILSGSPERMAEIEAAGQLDSWYSENKRFMEERYGKSNIISFALHRDEKTPTSTALLCLSSATRTRAATPGRDCQPATCSTPTS